MRIPKIYRKKKMWYMERDFRGKYYNIPQVMGSKRKLEILRFIWRRFKERNMEWCNECSTMIDNKMFKEHMEEHNKKRNLNQSN